MPDREVTALANAGDGPPVPVFDPVGRTESESAVVPAGDDHISDARLIAVGQGHLACRLGVVEAMLTSAAVEFGDKLAGRGEHDRVKADRSIFDPSGEGILNDLGKVTDVDAIVIEIEVECDWFAVSEAE